MFRLPQLVRLTRPAVTRGLVRVPCKQALSARAVVSVYVSLAGLVSRLAFCSRFCCACAPCLRSRLAAPVRRSFSGTAPVMTAMQGLDCGIVEGVKSSVSFETADRPGALEEALRLFWKYNINITRIESRPPKFRTHSFSFQLDFEGQPSDANVRSGTWCISSSVWMLRLLRHSPPFPSPPHTRAGRGMLVRAGRLVRPVCGS